MGPIFALISNFILVSTVVAQLPPPQFYITYPDLAGLIIQNPNGNITYAAAEFTVPYLSGSNSAAEVLVGIGGCEPDENYLQTGLDVVGDSNSVLHYRAMFEQEPDFIWHYQQGKFPIRPGDKVRFSVRIISATEAVTEIVNLTRNQSATKQFSHDNRLCGNKAMLGVIRVYTLGQMVGLPLTNFQSVTFENLEFEGSSWNGALKDVIGTISTMTQNNRNLTLTSIIGGDSVLIEYVGPTGCN